MRADKPIIGLAGGIGAGKSTVASMLAELGAAVIGADQLNHEELNSPEVLACLRRWWGPAVVGPDGRADREAIRNRVVGDEAARQRLEALVHPRIARRREALTRGYEPDPNVRAIVWDIPLLFETGLAEQCDHVVFVEAAESVRRERVLGERGWTASDFERFEGAQAPLDFKRSKADSRIVNNTDRDDLRRQVKDVFSRILAGGRAIPRSLP